jgi:hypothetical protein
MSRRWLRAKPARTVNALILAARRLWTTNRKPRAVSAHFRDGAPIPMNDEVRSVEYVPDAVQMAADDADYTTYRLQCKLDTMAAMYHTPDFKHASDMLKAVRAVVRKHMHRHDLEKTHG